MSAAQQDLESYLDVEEKESRKIQSRNLRRLIRETLGQPGPLAFGFIMILVGTAAVLLEPRVFGYAIDEAIVPRDGERLRFYALILLLVTSVRAAAVITQTYCFELLGQRVTQKLRVQLFGHLQRLPVGVFDKHPAGRLLTRVTNDIGSLSEMFSAGFVSMVCNALMVVGILAWLMVLDLRLGLVASAIFPVLVAFSVYFSRRLKIAYREARSKLSALNAFLAENFMGMRVVHLFNRQGIHLQRFDRINQWYTDAQIGTVRIFAFFQPTITLCVGISMALVIWFGGIQASEGGIKLGVLVAFFSYVFSLFQPVREIADKWNIFLSGMASAERIFSILDWSTETTEEDARQAPPILQNVRGHIVFENVWFAYNGEHWVLKDFSLEILPGQHVGVVGHTGAGKTTFISLLMRFYEPQKGRILLDGKDLREYDRRALRHAFGIVQQDAFLFSGSIQDNVTFWSKSVSEEQVRLTLGRLGFGHLDAAKAIQERGSNFSMGEKQALAFARVLTADPRIWILDEATANMDSRTEQALQETLDEVTRGKTSILIAHRLATVRAADQVIVLHKGVLVEKGNHSELLKRDGLYSRLYRYQAAQQEAAPTA